MFEAIQNPELGECRIEEPQPRELLAALHFFLKYPTKIAQAAFLGTSEKPALEKAWRYVRAFQALKKEKIRFFVNLLFFEFFVYSLICYLLELSFRHTNLS